MRHIETLFFLANLLTFFVLVIPRLRVISQAGYVALIALFIAFTQVLVEGPRWQMVPAYILAVLLFLVWLLHARALGLNAGKKRTNRLSAGLAIGLGVLGLAVSIALPMVFPVFTFPNPSGTYGIGTLTYH